MHLSHGSSAISGRRYARRRFSSVSLEDRRMVAAPWAALCLDHVERHHGPELLALTARQVGRLQGNVLAPSSIGCRLSSFATHHLIAGTRVAERLVLRETDVKLQLCRDPS